MQSLSSYIVKQHNHTYNFTTKNGVDYSVIFITDETFSTITGEEILNVFQLVIEKLNNVKDTFDPIVAKTVEKIVNEFLLTTENSLIFYCSNHDLKEVKRFNTFSRWYEKSDSKDKIFKKDKIIEVSTIGSEVQKLYTSVMLHRLNPEYDKILNSFDALEELLKKEK